jgi:hypothetical protein
MVIKMDAKVRKFLNMVLYLVLLRNNVRDIVWGELMTVAILYTILLEKESMKIEGVLPFETRCLDMKKIKCYSHVNTALACSPIYEQMCVATLYC